VATVAVGVKDKGGHIKGGITFGVEEGEEQLERNGGEGVRTAEALVQPLAGAVRLEATLKDWQQMVKFNRSKAGERQGNRMKLTA
jgi:hypothetical protein